MILNHALRMLLKPCISLYNRLLYIILYEDFLCVYYSSLKFNIRVYRGGGFTLKSTARQQTYKT